MQDKKIQDRFRGVIAPVLTAFKEDRSLDLDTYQQLIDWLCQSEIRGLFPMGGSGEYQTLSLAERKTIIDIVADVNKQRRIFIAGTGGNNLQETTQLSEYAQLKGADGVGIVIPDFIPADESSIFNYYKAIDQAITLPIMIYDPRGEGPYMATPALMRRLLDGLKNISGIKYRTTNAEYMANMAAEIASHISLLSGNECTYLQDLVIGAVGCVGGGGNFYPGLMWKLQDYFEQGDISNARALQYKIIAATYALNHVYWPLSGKIVLQELGIPFRLITRVKGNPFSAEDVQTIRTYYRELLRS
jgi:4-hydroxy-tetrahydrodipicolinate synthase